MMSGEIEKPEDVVMAVAETPANAAEPEEPSDKLRHPDVLAAALISYVEGSWALARARLFEKIVSAATYQINTHEGDDIREFLSKFALLKHLVGIDVRALTQFDEVWTEMALVYATALFDSFLSDVTLFLCLSSPERFLGGQNFSIQEIWKEPVSEIVNRRARSVTKRTSQNSFIERINFLEQKLALTFGITLDEKNSLKQWANVRHAIVHKRALFDISMDEKRTMTFRRAGREARIASRDVTDARCVYDTAVAKVFQGVRVQFTKRPIHEIEQGLIKVLLEPGDVEEVKT